MDPHFNPIEYNDINWDFEYSDELRTLKGIELIDMFDRKVILSNKGIWHVITNKKIFSTHQNNNLIPFFPFLELKCEEFILLIKTKLSIKKIPANTAYTFPLREIILSSLNMQSDYWVNASIKWLECFPVDYDTSSLLLTIMQSNWLSQPTRHLAKHLFFKFKKHNHNTD